LRTRWRYTNQNDLEQHLLVNLHELLIPLLNVGRLLAGVGIVVGSGGIVAVVFAPFDHLAENGLIHLYCVSLSRIGAERLAQSRLATYVVNGNWLSCYLLLRQIFNKVLDEDGPLTDLAIYKNVSRWYLAFLIASQRLDQQAPETRPKWWAGLPISILAPSLLSRMSFAMPVLSDILMVFSNGLSGKRSA
jgi:hypothetical protein